MGSITDSRIICIGNSLLAADQAGPRVYSLLAAQSLPAHLELVEGGLAGLDLLALLEHVGRVVFVDAVSGFLPQPGIVVLDLPHPDIEPGDYGHDAGIGYLLAIAPKVLETPMPRCLLVGIEGAAGPELIRQAAALCLQVALQEDLADPACRPAELTS